MYWNLFEYIFLFSVFIALLRRRVFRLHPLFLLYCWPHVPFSSALHSTPLAVLFCSPVGILLKSPFSLPLHRDRIHLTFCSVSFARGSLHQPHRIIIATTAALLLLACLYMSFAAALFWTWTRLLIILRVSKLYTHKFRLTHHIIAR